MSDAAASYCSAWRPERSPSSSRIDFALDQASSYMPTFRYHCALLGDEIIRPDWREKFTGGQLSVTGRIDGQSVVGEIIASIRWDAKQFRLADGGIDARSSATQEMFRKWDFLEFSIEIA